MDFSSERLKKWVQNEEDKAFFIHEKIDDNNVARF